MSSRRADRSPRARRGRPRARRNEMRRAASRCRRVDGGAGSNRGSRAGTRPAGRPWWRHFFNAVKPLWGEDMASRFSLLSY